MSPVKAEHTLLPCVGAKRRIKVSAHLSASYASHESKIFSTLSLMPTSDPYDAKQLTHLH